MFKVNIYYTKLLIYYFTSLMIKYKYTSILKVNEKKTKLEDRFSPKYLSFWVLTWFRFISNWPDDGWLGAPVHGRPGVPPAHPQDEQYLKDSFRASAVFILKSVYFIRCPSLPRLCEVIFKNFMQLINYQFEFFGSFIFGRVDQLHTSSFLFSYFLYL